MNRDSHTPQARLVKGPPIFKRHLYISSALFVLIILITTFVLIRLAMDSLKDRVNSQLSALGETYVQQIREQIQILNLAMRSGDTQAETRRNTQVEAYLDSLVADPDEQLVYVFIQDLSGEVLWKSLRHGMELEQNHFSKVLFSPRNPRTPKMELPSLSNPRNIITDLIQPIVLNDEPQLIIHLGVDNSILEKRFGVLRGIILNRILLAASTVVGILTVTLLYVLWLLKKAQLVEAEAHMADHLANLGALASGLAHEIRNPLSAMNLNLQMIEEEIAPDGNSDLGTLLRGTKQEIDRLARLASNFLTYAKPVTIDKQRICLTELIDEVLLLVSKECARNGIKLKSQHDSLSLFVEADRDLLKQAILNLLVNAQDAVASMPEDSRSITLGSSAEGHKVQIRVSDTGSGISGEEGKNLFKLFYSSKRGGTGLGLPIAQKIVERHNGSITWGNRVGGGAEFVIHLPA
jgi:two-component system, NtrC family, sensor histidine kinase HydH